ncbi:hypothetical protein ACGFJC_47320 [Nonomuraea fuscirosea]|uniref:hypothetical protein n=1 Tax=Nonomuraea fuscirosea TaxID=1291556 RepID=UPI003721A212
MIRIRPRRSAEPKQAPRPRRVCVDRQPADEIARGDGWVTIRRDDGSTPNVLADRVSPCTCEGGDCRG